MKYNRRRPGPGFRFAALRFNAFDWMWIVGGDETRAYSSKGKDYVDTTSDEYLAWEGRHGYPTRIHNESELWDVLAQNKVDR